MEYAAFSSIGSRASDQRDRHTFGPGMSITGRRLSHHLLASRSFMIDEATSLTWTDYIANNVCRVLQYTQISYEYAKRAIFFIGAWQMSRDTVITLLAKKIARVSLISQ